MAKTRRSKASKGKSKRGIFGYIYSPIDHTLMAADNVARATTNTLRNIVSTGIRGVDRVGRKVTGHADAAVSNLLMTRRRKSRKNGGAKRNHRSRKN
jgi:hypothetical protein